MTKPLISLLVFLAWTNNFVISARAQLSLPPASPADLEETYKISIEHRVADILAQLKLTDQSKAGKVHDLIIDQYHVLRARDAAIDAELKTATNSSPPADRAKLFQAKTKPLHDQFLAKLSAELSPDQVECVKDRMTYDKVKVTFDAYCAIVPNLTEQDKAQILTVLKDARDEAIDGGSAKEKSDIFQKYKDRINAYLDAHGHSVAKAYLDWQAKQDAAKKTAEAAPAAPKP